MSEPSGILTVVEAAKRAGVRRRVLDYAISAGHLTATPEPETGQKGVRATDLAIFLKSRYGEVPASLASSVDETASGTDAHGDASTPDVAGADASEATVQSLSRTIKELKHELDAKQRRIEELETQLEATEQRWDAERADLLQQLEACNTYASEASAGAALDALRASGRH